jgi:hypothetical protein
MYLTVSSSVVVLGDIEKGLTTLCDKIGAIADAGKEADARLSLLQAKVSKIAEKSEPQIARAMVSIRSQNVQKNKITNNQFTQRKKLLAQ